jgi:hypothetical protein
MNTPNGATRFERFGRALGRAVLARPGLVLALCATACAVGALGLGRASFSTDYRVFFSSEDPGLGTFRRLESAFAPTDNVLFVVKAGDGDAFGRDALAALQALTDEGWRLPHAARVDSPTNFPRARADGDDVALAPLVPRPAAELSAAEIAEARAAAAGEPLLAGALVSRDGGAAAVNVTLRLPPGDPRAASRVARAAREAAGRVGAAHPGLDVRASGMALMNDAFMDASVRDMAFVMPATAAVMLVAMALTLGSAWATAAVAAVVWLSAALALGLAGWLGYPLTPPSVAAPVVVLTVAVADGVHVVLAAAAARRGGRDRRAAVGAAVAENLEAITYTWLTTLVGFLCLNYSEAPPVRHLANMTAFGVTAAYVLSFTLLPALLALLPWRARPARPGAGRAAGALARRLGDFVVRRRVAVLAGALLATAAGGTMAARLETDDQFVQYFDPAVPFRRDADFTLRNLSGLYRLEYQVGSADGVTDPAYLADLGRFVAHLRAQPEVDHVYALTDVLARVRRALDGDGPPAPPSREAAAEALLAYEMNLPAGLDLRDRVNVDKTATRVSVTVKDMSTKELTRFAARTEAWLRANAPPAMWAEATGPVVIFARLGDRNAASMVRGDFLSLALITACMALVLRSTRLGLLSVVPNVLPVVLGYGAWWATVGRLNVVASVAGSISLGIIVDDTIHFLTNYRRSVDREGRSPEDALRATLAHVGPAMVTTSGVLALGFLVLTRSAFQMTAHLGWLSALIVGTAPLADLVVAPALVLCFARRAGPLGARRSVAPPPPAPPAIDVTQLKVNVP